MVDLTAKWLSVALLSLAVAGCAARSDVSPPPDAPAAETVAPGPAPGPDAAPVPEAPEDAGVGPVGALPATADDTAGTGADVLPEQAPEEGAPPAPPEAAADPPRRGFLGLFGGGGGSLFGAANAAPGPADAPGGAVVDDLPFGRVATVCGLSPDALGDAVDQAPKDGRPRWQLHDPIPQATGPRPQFITGFRDRCARQITGALVLFGTAGVHEATRYDDSNTRPYSETDTAYEQVKSRLCGVRPNIPCPADRIERLNDAVRFATVYPAFGSTSDWFELLLVEGELVASAMSGR